MVAGGFTVYILFALSPTLQPLPDPNQPAHMWPGQMAQTAPAGERQTVAALGRLEPQGETITIGVSGNDRLGRLLVHEGQEVEAGTILVYLESYAERLAEKNYAASQLRDAEARLAAETVYGKASIAEAEIRLKQEETLRPLDLQAQEAKVQQLEEALAVARKDLQRFKGLQQKGVISQQGTDHQSLQEHRAREELYNAQVVLARLKAAYSSNLLMAQSQVKTAQASLARVQTSIQLASLQSNLELAQARLDRTILRAPQHGTILRLLKRPGESVDRGPILQMGHTQQMYIVAEIYETDIGLVRLGQTARVTSPALPEALIGTVEHIGNMIAKNDILDVDPTANTDARVVEVKIRLDHSTLAARLINLQVYVLIYLTDQEAERTARVSGQ
jgi:HlyD family secretion protein